LVKQKDSNLVHKSCLHWSLTILENNFLEEKTMNLTDINNSLLDLVNNGPVAVGMKVKVIPGEHIGKTYNFLLFHQAKNYELTVGHFIEVLTRLGYGGTVLFHDYNLSAGISLAKTGKLDGLLFANFHEIPREGHANNIHRFYPEELPVFDWDGICLDASEYFHKSFEEFLTTNFPL
jgi:hypothetical protein